MRFLDRRAPAVHDAIKTVVREVGPAANKPLTNVIYNALGNFARDPLSAIEGPAGAVAGFATRSPKVLRMLADPGFENFILKHGPQAAGTARANSPRSLLDNAPEGVLEDLWNRYRSTIDARRAPQPGGQGTRPANSFRQERVSAERTNALAGLLQKNRVAARNAPPAPPAVTAAGPRMLMDEAGQPLTVYHGGTPPHNFDTAAEGYTQLGPGAYFGEIGAAEEFAQFRPGGTVEPYHLSFEKPFDETGRVAPTPEMLNALRERLRGIGVPGPYVDELDVPYRGAITNLAKAMGGDAWKNAAKINAELRAVGFDGIIADWHTGGNQYVAFNPKQIVPKKK